MAEPSVFSKIIAGELSAERIYEDEQCIVIPDRSPQAPTHLLIIPRKPLINLSDAETEDKPLLGHLMWVAAEVGRKLGLDGFRLVVNNGHSAGQTVFHLHIHLLAQKKLSEQGLAVS
ncbi:histidine triad nucleotide-binding protein [Microbulbifer thermotolerans]|uniref:Histidine triad nucleotide-binding protein n=1 Tax=Microbulbifer thermotolerans TaxID=252514 RepID=A0A143HMB7_MICTH|nr:histidine triad nucleotide-binding protein [Microbulbifer thermotolerans]AMX02865.1 histidine triad nucleotide-binding protein [Microbulbifer thermotolerans]MCX2780511.1 histidine triad nucleotide-binding protein [Microbulbifer thermotolerans]MCX2784110.1 histidine triad nucleotide-binding protein [Microbulbifer thermotolerans]MCX2794879.1 histidine triad nucleotide-binding protein [Microbulbifer thermotolerans]MCX2803071.1 histidine triad nucleotide-binding protein [Microbulbifer thermotol